jgi:hypothetical protein
MIPLFFLLGKVCSGFPACFSAYCALRKRVPEINEKKGGMWGICALLFLCFLTSCVHTGNVDLPVLSDAPKPPVEVRLSKAYIVERTILLKIQVEVLNDLSASETVIGVIGLREGMIGEEQYMILADVVNRKSVFKGERIQLDFSLESGTLTEFQVKAFWGEDGKKVIREKVDMRDIAEIESDDIFSIEPDDQISLAEEREEEGSVFDSDFFAPEPFKPRFDEENDTRPYQKVMEVVNIQVHEDEIPCELSSCPMRIMVRGVLRNNAPGRVGKVKLVFGLFWVPDGKLPAIPEDRAPRKPGEEEMSFGDKVFSSGESVDFEVAIGRPVYQIPGGTFMPHIRVLAYEEF